jgi:glycosyltransferase involved in cell wall biosynthesis
MPPSTPPPSPPGSAQRPPVSVILLAHNEAATIERELTGFHEAIVAKLPGSELIVAEDGSTDGTTEIIQRLEGTLHVVHRFSATRLGYARALREAVLAAKNDWVFFSDTGLKHDPHDFWKLYERIGDTDLIVGRKTNRSDQLYRRALTLSFNTYLRLYFDLDNIFDADSGFRLFNRKVIDAVFRKEVTFKSLVGSEIVLRTIFAGLRYAEVPVSYSLRVGESKGMPPRTIARQIWRVVGDLAKLKRERKHARP